MNRSTIKSASERVKRIGLDKDMLLAAKKELERWNVEKERARAEHEGNRSSEQAWADYNALWEFGQRIGRGPNRWSRKEKLESYERYYNRLRKLEAWRSRRAHKA